MKMPKISLDATRRLEALVAGDPRVRIKKMFGQPAGFVNGNLCLGTFGTEIFVRLSDSHVESLSKVAGVRPFEPMAGRPMKHYLVVPPSMLAKPLEVKKWVRRSVDYVQSLPPK